MKQAWQIPAAVAATAVLTFVGVSMLQANANAPLKALGANLQSHTTPSPIALGVPVGGGAASGDGTVSDELLAGKLWGMTPKQEAASQALSPSAPPLKPRQEDRLTPVGQGPSGAQNPGPISRADEPDGHQRDHESSPDASQGIDAGQDKLAATGGEGVPAPHDERTAVPSPVAVPSPAVVTAQKNGWTAWGTSQQMLDTALRAAAAEEAAGLRQGVTVGNGRGLGPSAGPQGVSGKAIWSAKKD